MTLRFAGQKADIEIDDSTGTAQSVGIIDNPEVVVNKDVQELRGTGEATWQDLQQTSITVGVSGDITQWDLDTWKTIVGYDEAVDELDNSADVPTFTVTVLYEDQNGDVAAFPVQECYDDSLPIGGSREEWIGMSLDATGRTIANVDAQSDQVA